VFSSPSPPTIVEEFLPSSDIAPADDQGSSRDIQESLAHETTENRRRRKPTCLKTAGSWEAPSNRAPWPLQIRNWVLSTLVLCSCCSCSSPLYVSLSLSLSLCVSSVVGSRECEMVNNAVMDECRDTNEAICVGPRSRRVSGGRAPALTHTYTRIGWVWSVYCHSLPAEASHRSTFCVHPRTTKQCPRLKICNGEKADLEWPAQRAWNLDCPVADSVYYTYPSWWQQRQERKKDCTLAIIVQA
jgi:hypothetical protein